MSDGLAESEARTTLKEIESRLNSLASEKEGAAFLKEIYSSLFTSESKTVYSTELGLSCSAKTIIIDKYYSNVLEGILSIAARPWFYSLKNKDAKVYESFFTEAEPQSVFVGLTIVLGKASHTNVIKECVWLLESFADNERFTGLFWIQAKVLPKVSLGSNSTYDPSVTLLWNDLIRRVISLPDKVSNVFKLPKGSVLWPKNFFLMLGKVIIEVISLLHGALTGSKDCSLGFLSQIIAKICIVNHGDDLFSILLPEMEKMIQLSPLWCRICHKLFSSVPDSSLEAVIEPLLIRCRSPTLLCNLLGDIAKPDSNRLKFLMTHKFILQRYYNKDTIPFCIIGYLALSKGEGDKPLVETLKKLLDVWGNASALKHRAHEQHLYITKCILLALGFLRQKHKGGKVPQELGSALTIKLLDALPPHLESPIENFRHLGMVVAEEITSLSQVKGIEPLKFEFTRNEETDYLSLIAREPAAVLKRFNAEQKAEDIQQTDAKSHGKEEPSQNQSSPQVSQMAIGESDLDSDDDLEPYPMDEEDDATVSGVRPPVYLSDCISGLLSKDDPSRVEACLVVTEKLVRREPAELPEVAVELVKILLYLQDHYNTKDFVLLRHGAMVATAVKCPKKVVEYLTTEFYQENYNLRQRMDMLEVITATAQELSQPVDEDPKSLRKHLPLPNVPGIAPRDKPDWQVVVEERIKNKTRIISHGRRNPEPVAVANKFSSVAGDFFFPLLRNFDSKCNTFDLLGQDFIVLGKLVQTLGSIIQASAGLNITRLMASAMLDFIWGVRYHREPFVRQALLYGICMVVLACPTHILITELNSEIMECHSWVSDVCNNDPDTDCRKLALQALILLDDAIKKEFS